MKSFLSVSALAAALLSASTNTAVAFSTSSIVRTQNTNNIVGSSFVGYGRHALSKRPITRRASSTTTASSTSLSMGIDSLSDDCVAAVKESHDIGNEIGMTSLTKELLFAGIVRHPERASKTLNKYNVDTDEVKKAALEVSKYAPGVSLQEPPAPEERKPLPFSSDCKLLLNRAFAIAESMESTVTRSEHVLLALMGYNNGKKIDNSPIIGVLQKVKSISRTDAGFKVFNFCEDLVNELPLTPMAADDTTVKREAVVIGGASGTTNTLAEVGVDMTQLALEGKYDAVFGRNDEIKSVLRTLGRRRKNNPCLIGGKKIHYCRRLESF